jgi:hypothetical protein
MRGKHWLTVAVLTLACSAGGDSGAEDRSADREAIQAAVVRYQYRQFVKGMDEPVAVCLSVQADGGMVDPSDRLLHRLRDLPGLRRGTECVPGPEDGVVVRNTGAPAVRLTVGSITWRRADDVEVQAGYHRSPLSSARPTYRVVRERGGWISLGPTMRTDGA